jgi:hypothetical protein
MGAGEVEVRGVGGQGGLVGSDGCCHTESKEKGDYDGAAATCFVTFGDRGRCGR